MFVLALLATVQACFCLLTFGHKLSKSADTFQITKHLILSIERRIIIRLLTEKTCNMN